MDNIQSLDYSAQNNQVIIIVPEIYGNNCFIKELAIYYHNLGYDIVSMDFYNHRVFEYQDNKDAYHYFMNQVGFDRYKEIEEKAIQLKQEYNQVFILGLSVGATMAWRCSTNKNIDGIICCYGSRVRDYLEVEPQCPTLFIFSKENNYNVQDIIDVLNQKNNVDIEFYNAEHGFIDQYSQYYDSAQKQIVLQSINQFLER